MNAIINGKSAQSYVGHPVVLAMQSIAKARQERSLHDFTMARDKFTHGLLLVYFYLT